MIWSETETGRPVTVTVPHMAALLEDISRRFDAGQGFSVATMNLDHVVKLARDRAFRKAYGAQTHVTADGHPVLWLSRLAGQGGLALAPGSDLILPCVRLAAEKAVPVAFFGSAERSLKAAAAAMEREIPGVEIALKLSPPMNFDPTGERADNAIRQIEDSGAGLVILALGAPKQEMFAARAQEVLPNIGFLSVGAGLDFIADTQTRAPRWVRALAAEWLWRMLSDPQRLGTRYIACLVAMPGLTFRAIVAGRRA